MIRSAGAITSELENVAVVADAAPVKASEATTAPAAMRGDEFRMPSPSRDGAPLDIRPPRLIGGRFSAFRRRRPPYPRTRVGDRRDRAQGPRGEAARAAPRSA